MRITPLDIKKQDFRKVFRGYDPDEVDAFLEMVAEEYEDLIRQKNELADEVLKLRTQLRDYQEVERTLKETLVTAQQTINESKESSRREADLIIREAHVKADEILEGARKEFSELKNEIMMLRSQKESLARRLRHLLESQLELLGVLEMEDVKFPAKENEQTKSGVERRAGSRFELAGEEEPAPEVQDEGEQKGTQDQGENSGAVIY